MNLAIHHDNGVTVPGLDVRIRLQLRQPGQTEITLAGSERDALRFRIHHQGKCRRLLMRNREILSIRGRSHSPLSVLISWLTAMCLLLPVARVSFRVAQQGIQFVGVAGRMTSTDFGFCAPRDILAACLKPLEAAGVVRRQRYRSGPLGMSIILRRRVSSSSVSCTRSAIGATGLSATILRTS